MSDILENYEHYLSVLEEIGEEPSFTEEEFDALDEEQLDELSSETKKSYAEKASNSAKNNWNRYKRSSNKEHKARNAGDSDREAHHKEKADKAFNKWRQRDLGIKRATNWHNEETEMSEEQIDELSRGTVTSYVKKVSSSKGNDSKDIGKRVAGLKMAAKKLKSMKEEEEFEDETLDDVLDEMKKPNKPKLKYKLDAEYSDGKNPINKGYHKSKGAVRKHVDSLEKRERWPVGHDAVMTNRKTGKQHMYTDKLEPTNESTIAADSLATHPIGKADAMAHLLGHMNSMSKGEAIDFFQKVMAQFGPGKEFGVADHSGQNQATIDSKLGAGPKTADAMPHLNVKEDIEEMFNGQDLSEEFKANVATLFEAAVSARVIAEQAVLEEAYEDALAEEVANINEELTTKLNTYLDHVVGHWMEENEVAIESTLRNELAGEFIEGLKNLFAEHYINVPEEKVEAIEALADKVSVLESKLDETISENVELKNMILEAQATEIFEELSSDLALTQRDKFSALAEGVEFDGDLDTYAKKLMIVKENYFGHENTSYSSNIEEETFEGEISESVSVDPLVNRYVQALTRTVKNK